MAAHVSPKPDKQAYSYTRRRRPEVEEAGIKSNRSHLHVTPATSDPILGVPTESNQGRQETTMSAQKIFPGYISHASIVDVPKLCPKNEKIFPGYLGRALCKFCFPQIALVPACGAIFTLPPDSSSPNKFFS